MLIGTRKLALTGSTPVDLRAALGRNTDPADMDTPDPVFRGGEWWVQNISSGTVYFALGPAGLTAASQMETWHHLRQTRAMLVRFPTSEAGGVVWVRCGTGGKCTLACTLAGPFTPEWS